MSDTPVVPPAHIVVGGTSGMGLAAARCLAASGCRLVLVGRDPEKSREVASTLGARGEGSADGGLEAALQRALDHLGCLDGMAVTAGPIHSRGDALSLTDAQWAEMFDTQLMTVVRSLRAAVPAMQRTGGGAIVTCAAYSVRAPKPALLHYAALKSAVATFTKGIAKAYGGDAIRANCIAPGAFATPALGLASLESLWQEMRDKYGMKAGLDRIGDPAEAGELIAFLLSAQARYLTGALINIDGGTDF